MKVKFLNLVTKIVNTAVAMALLVAVANADSTCLFWSYQPNLPEELNE